MATASTPRVGILEKRESKNKPDRGIVYVETKAYNQKQELVLTVRRKVLIPKTPQDQRTVARCNLGLFNSRLASFTEVIA
jgi:hypothetical protein